MEENQKTENVESNGNRKMPKPELEVIWFTEGDIISAP